MAPWISDKRNLPCKRKKVGLCIIGWELPSERKCIYLFSLAGNSHYRIWFPLFFVSRGRFDEPILCYLKNVKH